MANWRFFVLRNDAVAILGGTAASDLRATFVDRWLHHPDHTAIDAASVALRGIPASRIPSPSVSTPSPVDAPACGLASMIVARAHDLPREGALPRQRDVRTLLLRAIKKCW